MSPTEVSGWHGGWAPSRSNWILNLFCLPDKKEVFVGQTLTLKTEEHVGRRGFCLPNPQFNVAFNYGFWNFPEI